VAVVALVLILLLRDPVVLVVEVLVGRTPVTELAELQIQVEAEVAQREEKQLEPVGKALLYFVMQAAFQLPQLREAQPLQLAAGIQSMCLMAMAQLFGVK
jgi:hypothetical protein